MFVILLGPPGAGKGTQADLLAAGLRLPKVSTGELFREAMAKGSPLGVEVARYIDHGQLVPDEITIDVLSERLARPDAQRGAVLDGVPRTIRQAEALDRLLAARGEEQVRVIDVEVPIDELLRRLAGRWTCRRCHATYHEIDAPPRVAGVCDRCGGELYQRSDDTLAAVRTRLQQYRERTAPLLDFYRRRGLLNVVHGAQPRDGVTRALLAALPIDGATT